MAQEQVEQPEDGQPEEGGKGSKKLLIIVSLVLLLLLGGGAAAYFLLLGNGDSAESGDEVEVRPSGPPIYKELDPPFVANLADEGRIRWLQVSVQVMVRDRRVLDAITRHEPVIRNDLLTLFSDQTRESLSGREARESLRVESLRVVRDVLREKGEPHEVEQIYFTSFIIQ